MRKIFAIISLLFGSTFVNAQTITISGKIVDAETSNPLPYAGIQLEDTGIGTTSTLSGNFKINIPEKNIDKKMSFSYLGYKTIQIPIIKLRGTNPAIRLYKEDQPLDEVIIMPDSTLLTLLKKAYDKIPENYPMLPSMQKGFYRETARFDDNQYLYFSEAVIENYKSPYKYNTDNGQVKILKSITNEFAKLDSLKVRFSQGVFMANEGDFVKKRADFINPKHFKNFAYSLNGTTKYQNNNVYVINFDTRGDTLKGETKGKFYLDIGTLAYIAFETEDTDKGISNYNKSHIRASKLSKNEVSVEYVKIRDKWHVKHVLVQDEFKQKNKTIYVDGEFVSTEIFTDLIKPIPLAERLNLSDLFSEKAKEYYSETYWEEYNVLNKDSLLDKQIKLLYSPNQSKELLTQKTKYNNKNSLLKIISRFNTRWGLCFLPVSGNEGIFSVGYQKSGNSISFSENLKPFDYAACLNIQFDYSINNRWTLNYSVSRSLNKVITAKLHDFGASYKLLLNKWTKPLILDLSLKYSFSKFSRNFSDYTNNSSFRFGNKTIDAEKLAFGIGYNTNGLLPQLGLNYQIKNNLWFYTSAGYFIPMYTSQKLYVSEKSGFPLFRKDSSIKLSNNSLQVKYNGMPTTTSHVNFENYNIKLGLIIKF